MMRMGEAQTPQETTTSTVKRARKPRAVKKQPQFAGDAPALPLTTKEPGQFGRVAITDVTPANTDAGFAARVELGEPFRVGARVFMEGTRHVGATGVLKSQRGRIMARKLMTPANDALESHTVMLQAGEHSDAAPWDADFETVAKQLGNWKFAIEGWADTFADWLDAAEQAPSSDDVAREGSEILARWAGTRDAALDAQQRKMLRDTAKEMLDETVDAADRIAIAHAAEILALHETNPLRDGLTSSADHALRVERPKSSFGSWYQFFPRSEGATKNEAGDIVPGTLRTAMSGLERAKAEGFTIVYLPSLLPVDASGAVTDHTSVDPALGTFDDFKTFVECAHKLGIEVALDFVLQFAADTMWRETYPQWFRNDGTIDYDNDFAGITEAVEAALDVWIEAGVTAFHVSSPEDAPVRLWQDVIANVTKTNPHVMFLAEDSDRPSMTRALAYAGFTQTYGTFAWRNTRQEVDEFLVETNSDAAFWQHNAFWPTTPESLSNYLRDNAIAGYAVRAVLAAMGSPTWGVTSGYELVENTQRDGSEKPAVDEYGTPHVRDWDQAGNYGIAELVTTLNAVRAAHPATMSYHNLTLLPSANPAILAFARQTPAACTGTGKPDTLIVVVNLDGHHEQQSTIHIDLNALGLPTNGTYRVKDELTGREFDWSWDNYVALAPWADVAHILSVEY